MNIIFALVLLILFSITPERTGLFNSDLNKCYALIYFIVVFLFFLNQARYIKNWIRFDVIFLLGFTIVHIQTPGLASLGVEPQDPDFLWFNKDVVNYATWLSVVAAVLWMWGYSSYRLKGKYLIDGGGINFTRSDHKVIDIIIVVIFLCFFVTVGPSVYQGVYDGNDSWGSGAVYVFLSLNILINLRVIYFFSQFKKDEKIFKVFFAFFENKIFALALITYIFIFLLIGDRGPVLKILLFIAGAYSIYVKPISFKKLMVYALVGAFVFTLLGMGRSKSADIAGTKNILLRGYESFNQADNKIITSELAGSNRILYIALDQVPHKHEFIYGVTYPLYIVSIPPFLSGLLVKTFDIDKIYLGTANFFTILTLGYNSTWGVGSEILADIYVNFGVYGVFIIMFFFGRFASSSLAKASSLNTVYVIIYLCLLSEALSINRGMFLQFLKPAALMVFSHYFIISIKQLVSNKK